MSTISRDELDRWTEAWRLYFDEGYSLLGVAKVMHTRHENVRSWILALGGEIRPRNVYARTVRAAIERGERAGVLQEGETVCLCGLIYKEDGSGQCPACRDGNERLTEQAAWLDFEAHWTDRNLCKAGR